MTRQQQLEFHLDQLDISNVDLARLAGVAPSSVQRWTAGTIDPPLMLLRLLECLVILHEQRNGYSDMRKRWAQETKDETVQSA